MFVNLLYISKSIFNIIRYARIYKTAKFVCTCWSNSQISVLQCNLQLGQLTKLSVKDSLYVSQHARLFIPRLEFPASAVSHESHQVPGQGTLDDLAALLTPLRTLQGNNLTKLPAQTLVNSPFLQQLYVARLFHTHPPLSFLSFVCPQSATWDLHTQQPSWKFYFRIAGHCLPKAV